MTTPDWTPEDEAMAEEIIAVEHKDASIRAIVRWHKEKTAKMRAELSEAEKMMERMAEAISKASCDSLSGLYCEDDSCARKILPPILADYQKWKEAR